MDEVIFRGKTFKGKCLYGNLICKKLQNEYFNKYYISSNKFFNFIKKKLILIQ